MLGQTAYLEELAAAAAESVLKKLEPRIVDITARATEAAKPMIGEIIRKDVMPWTVAALAVMGAVAASIGSYFATRRR